MGDHRFGKVGRTMAVVLFGMLACTLSASLLRADDFRYPLSVAATADGTVYVADLRLPGIWKLANGKAEVFFQASKKFRTPLNAVRCVAIDAKGQLLAGDSATREVYRFDKSGKPVGLTNGGIGIPMDIAVDAKGDLYVADLELHRIWKVPANGGKPEEFAQVAAPRGVTFDAMGRLWVVCDDKRNKLQLLRISPDGKAEPVVKGRVFQFPHNVVLDEKNVAYVSDGFQKAIWRIDESGKPEKWITGKPLINPVGLCWHKGTLLVADPHAKAIYAASPDGKLTPFVAPKISD